MALGTPNMRRWRAAAATLVTAAALWGCGGSDGGPAAPYARLVSFGDSLSDVGSYRTAPLQAAFAQGAGQFTVNNAANTGTNWTQQLAAELALPAACAARVGLNSPSPFAVATVSGAPGCSNYAQGGSRVTDPAGIGQADLGALTHPLTTQVANFLADSGGAFAPTDLVTVLAGANDVLLNAGAVAAGTLTPQAAATAVATAGAQLAALVQQQLLARGAQRVVLVKLPNIGLTPRALAQGATAQSLLAQLSDAFNQQLAAPLAGEPRVLLVDAFAGSVAQNGNPARFGLANVTTASCDLARVNGTALFCSAATRIPGDAAQLDRYQFSDDIHPSPYGYQLIARTVTDAMTRAGWLAPWGGRPCNTAAAGCTLAPLPQ